MRALVKSGAPELTRSRISIDSSILSWAIRAAPRSQRHWSCPGVSASSARSQRSAVAARPARNAACACVRFSWNVSWLPPASMLLVCPDGHAQATLTRQVRRIRKLTRKAMPRTRLLPFILTLLVSLPTLAGQGRPLLPEDWYRFQTLSDLQISSDGRSVAYLVTSYDQASDESRAALWLASWSGGAGRPLSANENVSEPRFLPDGRQLSYLAAPSPGDPTQLWVVDSTGGKPRQLTHVKGEIVSYEWSPDGHQAVLVVRAESDSDKPRPVVIDALQFKADREGYLTAQWRSHLYLLDAASGGVQPLTTDPARADSLPAFSPDGRQIAYVSNRNETESQLGVDELTLIAASAGATPRPLLSTWSPNHQHLVWSPDGTQLVYLRGSEPRFNAYMMDELVLAEVGSARVRVLTHQLDRAVLSPAFSSDGKSIQFAVEDDGYQYPAQVVLSSGAIERLGAAMVVEELVAASGHTAVLSSSDHSAVEAYALERGELRALSAHNRALLAEINWGAVE